MDSLYQYIVKQPGRTALIFAVSLIGIASVPASWLAVLTPWPQSSEWARIVFQAAGLLLVVVFGVIPVVKWYEERVDRIVNKPIVVIDALDDGTHEIRNLGDKPAVNVWMLTLDGTGFPCASGR